jgi:hypothetical protein
VQSEAAHSEGIALDLFDRLRLREPFGHAFTALGFKGEEAWRAAARIKVLLLAGAGAVVPPDSALVSKDADFVAPVSRPAVPAASTLPDAPGADASSAATEKREGKTEGAPGPSHLGTGEGKTAPATSQPGEGKPAPAPWQSDQEQVALAPVLWLDPDVRWLCGVHESEGHFYLVRELYEELLWWLLMPALLRLASEPAPSRAAVEELSKNVADALHSAEAAEYRINTLLGPLAASETVESDEIPEPPAPAPDAEK